MLGWINHEFFSKNLKGLVPCADFGWDRVNSPHNSYCCLPGGMSECLGGS